MVSVEPYFPSKSVEDYVTLTSFTADLSYVRTFPLHTRCKIDAVEETESLVTIRLLKALSVFFSKFLGYSVQLADKGG